MQVKLNREELAQHVGRLISADRNATHGDPHMQFAVHCMLMDIVRFAEGYRQQNGLPAFNATQRHVITMDLAKTSRILVGNCNAQDHYLDKAGYNLIAAESCTDGVVAREEPDPPQPEPAEMTTEEAEGFITLEDLLDPSGEERATHAKEQEQLKRDMARYEHNKKARERYYRNKKVEQARRVLKEARNENAEVVKSPRASVHGEDGKRTPRVRWGRPGHGRSQTGSKRKVAASRKSRVTDNRKDL